MVPGLHVSSNLDVQIGDHEALNIYLVCWMEEGSMMGTVVTTYPGSIRFSTTLNDVRTANWEEITDQLIRDWEVIMVMTS